jgi:hypothetical protein
MAPQPSINKATSILTIFSDRILHATSLCHKNYRFNHTFTMDQLKPRVNGALMGQNTGGIVMLVGRVSRVRKCAVYPLTQVVWQRIQPLPLDVFRMFLFV